MNDDTLSVVYLILVLVLIFGFIYANEKQTKEFFLIIFGYLLFNCNYN